MNQIIRQEELRSHVESPSYFNNLIIKTPISTQNYQLQHLD